MRNTFTDPPRLPLIAPSILSADFGRMAEDCDQVIRAGADLLHVDVMDGHFVPNLTMGPDMVRGIKRRLPGAFLDVHLMVAKPAMYVEPFKAAGADHITFHAEVVGGTSAVDLANRIRQTGMTAGLAINPGTPASEILPVVAHFDLVLVMSVNPGFGGQAFIASVLAKVREIRSRLRPNQRLQMDGGLGPSTATSAIEAGCDTIVAGSAIFSHPPERRSGAMEGLRR